MLFANCNLVTAIIHGRHLAVRIVSEIMFRSQFEGYMFQKSNYIIMKLGYNSKLEQVVSSAGYKR